MDRLTPMLSTASGPGDERPVRLADTAPTAHGREREQEGSSAEHRLSLRGLGYYVRRERLFAALRALLPGQVLRLTADRAGDVRWLRYEVEARMSQRYRWSLPLDVAGAAEIVVRLP